MSSRTTRTAVTRSRAGQSNTTKSGSSTSKPGQPSTGTAPASTTTTTGRVIVRKPTAAKSKAVASAAGEESEQLAKELDRVLKVTQPKAGPSTRAASSSTTKTAALKATTTKPLARTTRVKSVVDKGKCKAKDEVTPPEWETALPWITAGDMKTSDRARAAMSAINASMKVLSSAVASVSKGSGDDGNTAETQKEIRISELALQALREIESEGKLEGKASEIERAAQGLIARLLSLKMYDRALEQLEMAHSIIQRQISHRKGEASSSSCARSEKDHLHLLPLANLDDTATEAWRIISFQCIIHSWTAMLASSILKPEMVIDSFPLPSSATDSSSVEHPFRLALSLPLTSVQPTLSLLHRQLVNIVTTDPIIWLHSRILAVHCLAILASTGSDAKVTPLQVWDHASKTASNIVDKAKADAKLLKTVTTRLGDLADWIEYAVKMRNGDLAEWTSCSEWTRFADYWMGLARKADDMSMIDRVLALMTRGVTISPRTPAKSAKSANPTPISTPQVIPSMSKKCAEDVEAQVTSCNAGLSKLDAVQRKYQDDNSELDGAALESAFVSSNLTLLSDLFQGMEPGPKASQLLSRTSRAVERVRRGALKIVPKTSGKAVDETSLHTSARQWLINAIDLVEDVMPMATDSSETTHELLMGAIDSLNFLSTNPAASSNPSIAHLSRAYRLASLESSCIAPAIRAHLLHCITVTAHNIAAQHWRSDNFKESLTLGIMACDWSKESLTLYGESKIPLSDTDEKAVSSLRNGLLKRYELVGACHQRLSNRKAAADAYSQALAVPAPTFVEQIEQRVNECSLAQVFPTPSDYSTLISRLHAVIAGDPDACRDMPGNLINLMRSEGLSEAYVGAAAERLFILLSKSGSDDLETLTQIVFQLGDQVLDIYKETEYPLRRLRVSIQIMTLIARTGQRLSDFDKLAKAAEGTLCLESLGKDTLLRPMLPSLLSMLGVVRALHTYHTLPDPTTVVLDLAREAMSKLRALILPPTQSPKKAPTVKRPLGRAVTTTRTAAPARAKASTTSRTASASKLADAKIQTEAAAAASNTKPRMSGSLPAILDDAPTLARLLGSLCSLLGLLGLTLQRIECLKLLRALMRGREEVIGEYVLRSAELGTEYLHLGKTTRAGAVFIQAIRCIDDSKKAVSPHVRSELLLRYCTFLATSGQVQDAMEAYERAMELDKTLDNVQRDSLADRQAAAVATKDRMVLARYAAAAVARAQGDMTGVVMHLETALRLRSRICQAACKFASDQPVESLNETAAKPADDPFTVPAATKAVLPDQQPAKDATVKSTWESEALSRKILNGLQWRAAEMLVTTGLDYAEALALRGSVYESTGVLMSTAAVAKAVKSPLIMLRVSIRQAELLYRSGKYDLAETKLESAVEGCPTAEGLDGVDIKRVRGDMLAKLEMIHEAGEAFTVASKQAQGLDSMFNAAEALLPSPMKSRLSGSTGAARASLNGSVSKREPLLPLTLAHVLRRQAWILREEGQIDASDKVLAQLDSLCRIGQIQAEKYHLDGRIGLLDAFGHFKADLWMSSLTESTIAMPMGSSKGRMRDRQSTRDSIQIILERSQDAYLRALEMSAASGRVEEVRSACLSLALLRAFQTSLGQGSEIITAAAAEMLASTPAITLHRELLEKIEHKLADGPLDDTKWPVLKRAVTMDHPTSVADSSTPVKGAENIDEACLVLSSSPKQTDRDSAYREYWKSVRARYRASFLQVDQEQVDSLPAEWVIVTINVTEDKNTMFISRHQRDREPLVFTLPLDRQGRRDGEAEEDLFTFDAAKEQMKRIIDESNDGARNAKHVTSQAGKTAWWEKRYSLDKQLKELVANLEFCWLGAFKTILSPRPALSQSALETFGARLERIFHSAIAGGARASDVKTRVQLDTPLLECFAALSSKCRDEEAEDLVYFILDVYQFHGVPVALAELDIDLIGIDLRSALAELEASRPSSPQPSETVFLALDKNVSCFPWESIPILRGRNASRVPSLPFLLHQWSMRDLIYPLASEQGKILVDSKKVFYILNPSGDLSRTQTHFEPWIQSMEKQAGWKGIMGRPPTELELEAVLKEYDLVLYFGHGGAEQYIHSHRVSKLTRCATTMLWGCSSGALVDQGDFDVRGTAWSYMMAGCPALVGTLWDVTDRDIDRLSESVFSKLHLDPSHVSSSTTAATTMLPISAVSLPEAVAKSRDECKLTYLTGAAPVVYGLPIWM